MTKFNKNMTDDEFLKELKTMDTTEVIEAFNNINEGIYEIHEASGLIEMLSCGDDIRYLLELQRDLPNKNLYDYYYILTGNYSFETNASDNIFELLDHIFENGWVEFKDDLIEYFSKKELN